MEPIQDYAAIGDGRTVALVSRRGSIDWLCWPRADSPSVFAALLDPEGGRFALRPAAPFRSERRYLPETNVLETRFVAGGGTAVVTDLMPASSEEDRLRSFAPDHELFRAVRCEAGEVELELEVAPRPGYAADRPRVRDAGPLGIRWESRSGLLVFRADLPVRLDAGGTVRARFRLRAGEERHLSLVHASEWPAILPPLGNHGRAVIDRTVAWWRSWARKLHYAGPFRDHVIRSALALRLLVHAPSGAILAAATTSLPERRGGPLNWDYRYCWLRDAALTARALFGVGCHVEAQAFVSWLLQATRRWQSEVRVLYDVHGNRPPPERTLGLAGYRGSRPVRVGNAAIGQLQLDVYGEVIEAAVFLVRSGGELDRDTRAMLRRLGEWVCRNWDRPDEGIWEPRSGRAHHTHSRVLCWTALDRLLALEEAGVLRGLPTERFRKNREAIRHDVARHGLDPAGRGYVATYGRDDVDAALLLLSWYGFDDAGSPRMRATYDRIVAELGAGDGLLYRYRGAESPGEGAFGICSFWGAEYLALGGGTAEESERRMARLVARSNDVGLFAEEIDPETGDALGNFPQAFTHVGLINAALSLERRLAGEPLGRGPGGMSS